jgi:hypothetical protein
MPQKYLYVKQGCISRWQYSSPNDKAFGLYTEGFFNCVIIVLRNTNKVVLIHADIQITLDDIRREIEWCGKDCEKYVYYKEHESAEETINDIFRDDPLKKDFTLKLIKALRKNGKTIPDTSMPLQNGKYIPEFEAVAVHVDFKDNTLSSGYLTKKEDYIKSDSEGQAYYSKCQKKKWATSGNVPGSRREYYEKQLSERVKMGDSSISTIGLEAHLAQARLNAMTQLQNESDRKEKSNSNSPSMLTAYMGSKEPGLNTALQNLVISKNPNLSSIEVNLVSAAGNNVIVNTPSLSTTAPQIDVNNPSSASKKTTLQ